MPGIEHIFRPFTPVNSFTDEREIREPVPVPEVGLRWGNPSQFEYQTERNQKKKDQGGGVKPVVVKHHWGPYFGETRTEIVVTDFSPVWREYEIRRVFLSQRNSDGTYTVNYENYIDIERTKSMLVPAGSQIRKVKAYYESDKYAYRYEKHSVPLYLHLQFPEPYPPYTYVPIIEQGTEGEWPEGRNLA